MGVRTIPAVLALAASIALLGLAACSGGGSGQGATPTGGSAARAPMAPMADVTAPSSADATAPAAPAAPSGPAIEVTWEALARERYLLENSRFRRPGAPMPPQKITLFSESHPEAKLVKRPRTKEERDKYSGSAVVPDRDMERFITGLQRQGFYRHAKRSGFDDAVAQSDNARGRIIVERDGQSYTLISLRGQGQNPNTRAIPKLYSETKQAVMVLRNMTPTLNVTHYGYSGQAR